MHLTWMVLSSNYANTLLALFPLACLAHELHWHAGFTLVFSGLPMLPLSLLIALSVEELSYKIGPTLSGVLSYSFGNVGTVIISCVLLRRGEILVVQTSLLGAIVFNLLAVIGCQYLASGVFRQEAVFNETIAQVNGSVLLLAVGTIALPAVLRQVQGEESVVVVSRGLAVPSMITYLLLLVFQFKTHSVLYNEWLREDEEEEDDSKEPSMLAPMPAIILLVAATA